MNREKETLRSDELWERLQDSLESDAPDNAEEVVSAFCDWAESELESGDLEAVGVAQTLEVAAKVFSWKSTKSSRENRMPPEK